MMTAAEVLAMEEVVGVQPRAGVCGGTWSP